MRVTVNGHDFLIERTSTVLMGGIPLNLQATVRMF